MKATTMNRGAQATSSLPRLSSLRPRSLSLRASVSLSSPHLARRIAVESAKVEEEVEGDGMCE